MTSHRVLITCVVVFALIAAVYVFAVTDSAAGETTFLHVLMATDGEFTELSYELSSDELSMLFDGVVLMSLLEGRHVRLSSPEAIDGATVFVEAETLEHFADVFVRFGPVAATWHCVKCCYIPDSECCCPDVEPPDPKDPDGD